MSNKLEELVNTHSLNELIRMKKECDILQSHLATAIKLIKDKDVLEKAFPKEHLMIGGLEENDIQYGSEMIALAKNILVVDNFGHFALKCNVYSNDFIEAIKWLRGIKASIVRDIKNAEYPDCRAVNLTDMANGEELLVNELIYLTDINIHVRPYVNNYRIVIRG